MKPKGLLIAVVLLAVLSGLVWWSNKKQAATKPAPDTSTKILSIPDDQFQDIRIKTLANLTIDLSRQDNKWTMTQPKPLAADQDAVSSMVSTLSSLNADKTVEGKTAELLIGNATLDSAGYYAKLASDSHVYTIASFAKTNLDKTPEFLRDKRLLTFDPDKLTRVELQSKGQTVEFGKNGQNEWQIVKPRPLRADSSQVSGLVDKLRDAKLDNTETAEDAVKKFAGAEKVATATVTDAAGSQTLEIRKDKDKNYFAKSSVVEGSWKTSAEVGDALGKGLDDFRNKKLFDFGFSDPSKVELKNVAYTKTGDKWMSGPKAMDNATVQT